jgi:hypothetical protein
VKRVPTPVLLLGGLVCVVVGSLNLFATFEATNQVELPSVGLVVLGIAGIFLSIRRVWW